MAPAARARRAVARPDPELTTDGFDYADAFVVPSPAGDTRPAVQLARAGLEGAPAALRALIVLVHRRILGFRLEPAGEGNVLGWHIARSAPDVVVLEASSPLMRGVLVARRDPGDRVRLSTYLYHRSGISRVLWWLVGPLHRRVAPYLLVRAVHGTAR